MVLFFTIHPHAQSRIRQSRFSAIAPRYVATNHVLSMGVDLLWRQRVVQLVSEWKPERLLDLATGTGDLALAILNAMPEIRLTGSDFCQPMLDVAARRGLDNLVCADAMNLPFPPPPMMQSPSPSACGTWPAIRTPCGKWAACCGRGAICSFWISPCLKTC